MLGAAVVAGVFALLGIWIGRRNEHRQWLRTERQRVCTDFLSALTGASSSTHKAIQFLGVRVKNDAIHEDALRALFEASDGVEQALAALEIIVPKDVFNKARRLYLVNVDGPRLDSSSQSKPTRPWMTRPPVTLPSKPRRETNARSEENSSVSRNLCSRSELDLAPRGRRGGYGKHRSQVGFFLTTQRALESLIGEATTTLLLVSLKTRRQSVLSRVFTRKSYRTCERRMLEALGAGSSETSRICVEMRQRGRDSGKQSGLESWSFSGETVTVCSREAEVERIATAAR